MANPQPDQFTRISNEILDHIIKFSFNGTQMRIVMTIWRYTYGFNRKSAELSINFLSKATEISDRNLRKELDRLLESKVIIEYKKPTKTKPREIGFNKDYDQWNILPSGSHKPVEQTAHRGEDQLTHSPVDQMTHRGEDQLHPQERQLKDNIKDNLKKVACRDIFDHWNIQKIKVHRDLTKGIEKEILKALKENSVENIKKSITRYAKMLRDNKCEWCDYIWGLDTFLSRQKGYKFFLDDGEKWLTYQKQLARRDQVVEIGKPRASPPQEFYISKEELAALKGGG